MKTYSQINKKSIVISVLNSDVPSLKEELILRTASNLAKSKGVQHLSLVVKSQIFESEVVKDYLHKFSDSIHYFSSLKEVKTIYESFDSKVVCSEEESHIFYDPFIITLKDYPLLESAISGDFETFKKYSFNDLREIDCRILFNTVRKEQGLNEIKEQINIYKDSIREQYFREEIFHIGDTVEHKGILFEILDRGSNYLTAVSEFGTIKRIWITEAFQTEKQIEWKEPLSEKEIVYKGYQTQNFHKLDESNRNSFIELIEKCNDTYLALKTVQLMDCYIGFNNLSNKSKLEKNISKIMEDVSSADYKTDKNGRRYRARRIAFGKKDDDKDSDQDQVKEELDTKLEYHDTLNKKLWDENDMLIPEVRTALIRIASAFEEFIDKDGKIFEIVDIIITGSNCNYNYTPQSDIDLHLIVNLDDIEDTELVSAFLTAKKTLWKDQHDIKIKGYDVELYAQDKNDHLVATGVYSIINNKWIEKPHREKLSIDNFSVQTKACDIINQIDNVIKGNATVKQIDDIKDKIRKMRQSGLSKGGEFSVENLAFKAIRNNGYFDKLNNLKKSITDKDLSLEHKE